MVLSKQKTIKSMFLSKGIKKVEKDILKFFFFNEDIHCSEESRGVREAYDDDGKDERILSSSSSDDDENGDDVDDDDGNRSNSDDGDDDNYKSNTGAYGGTYGVGENQ